MKLVGVRPIRDLLSVLLMAAKGKAIPISNVEISTELNGTSINVKVTIDTTKLAKEG